MLPNPQETADLVTFTEETLNGKLYFLLLTTFWQETNPFEALSCYKKFWIVKILGKHYFLQDTRKFKYKITILCLKCSFSSVLTPLTKSRPYIFLKTTISKSEAENLICAINRSHRVDIRSAVVLQVEIHSATEDTGISNLFC